MQVADIDSIGAFKHAWITRHDATLAKGVVFEQGADGSSTMLAGAIESGKMLVDGIQEGLPDMCKRRAEPKEVFCVTSGCVSARMWATVVTDPSRVL